MVFGWMQYKISIAPRISGPLPWYDAIWYDIWYFVWEIYDMIWYMIWYDVMWCDVIWYDAIRYGTVRYDTIWYDIVSGWLMNFHKIGTKITKIWYLAMIWLGTQLFHHRLLPSGGKAIKSMTKASTWPILHIDWKLPNHSFARGRRSGK